MYEQRSFIKVFAENKTGLFGLFGVVLIIFIGTFAGVIAEYPRGYSLDILHPPSMANPFGTDMLGLSVFAQVVWGARTSLYVSFVAVTLAAVIGIPAGLVSGYVKGRIGALIDSIIDISLTLPVLPLMIVIAAIMGPSVTNVAIVIGLLAWPSLARVTRNSTMKVAEMQYIEAARCLHISNFNILTRHVLLNIAGPVLVNLTLVMATAVLSESGLSFLGLGDPTAWSWGTILRRAWAAGAVIDMPNPWWWWSIPSAFIVFYVVCFNLLGSAVNEALNPRTS